MNAHTQHFQNALPDALEAEQALLGAILINNDAYWRVAGFLQPMHFQEKLHQLIYETAGTLIAEGRAANPITMKPYLPAEQLVGDLTVAQYLARLAVEAVNVINAYDYGRAIIEMWSRHRMIGIAQELDEMSRHMPANINPEKIIETIVDQLSHVAREGNERASSLKYGVVLPRAVDRAAKDSGDHASRIPWFLPEITEALGDMRRGNLIGLMSDSGGGKTSFSLQQLRFAAERGYRSALFSIEISEEEAALQAAAQKARIPLGRLDAFNLNSREKEDIEREMADSTDLPFHIVGFGDCTLSDIRVKLEGLVKSQGLDLVFIDHAKMIGLPNPRDIFSERINALYRGLKAMAKSLNVAIVILIQRNDEWKKRFQSGGSLRPVMGDAYGGGSIKQSLDVWFSIYRPEPLYRELIPSMPPERVREGELTKKQIMIQKMEASKGKAAIINHKRRRGEPGRCPEIKFEGEYTMFSSLVEDTAPGFDFDEGAAL